MAHFITPKTALRDKAAVLPADFDASAVARAEAALRALSGNFQTWMAEEVDKLEAARQAAKAEAFSDAALEAVHNRAHDAKGLGSTYEYPLVTAMAGSLCRLLGAPEHRARAKTAPALIDAHVDAIKAVVRAEIKTYSHPTGRALLDELVGRVDALIGAAAEA